MRVSKLSVVLGLALFAGGCSTEPNSDTQIIVVNTTGEPILAVRYSPCDNDQWGEDQLDVEEDILDGQQRAFNIDPGCYDVRVEFDAAGFDAVALRNQEISEDTHFEWAPAH